MREGAARRDVAEKRRRGWCAHARSGLGLPALHTWVRSTTPVQFDLYKPFNPIPLIISLAGLGFVGYILYAAWDILLPVVQSRFLWGIGTIVACLIFTSGYMWNKIKNAPFVQVGQDGRINWIAGGYSNQLGLESQVVGALCEFAWAESWLRSADVWMCADAPPQTAPSPSASSSSPSSFLPSRPPSSSASASSSGPACSSSSRRCCSGCSGSRMADTRSTCSKRRKSQAKRAARHCRRHETRHVCTPAHRSKLNMGPARSARRPAHPPPIPT